MFFEKMQTSVIDSIRYGLFLTDDDQIKLPYYPVKVPCKIFKCLYFLSIADVLKLINPTSFSQICLNL